MGGDQPYAPRLTALLVFERNGGAEAGLAVGPRARLDDLGVEELLAQTQDLGLQAPLGVLRGVVLGILLQVAPLAGGLDLLDHLGAFLGLQAVQLRAELLHALGSHQSALSHPGFSFSSVDDGFLDGAPPRHRSGWTSLPAPVSHGAPLNRRSP